MMVSILLAVALQATPVADYFPMKPGTKWTYEDQDGAQMLEEVEPVMDLGNGKQAVPKTQTASGHYLGTTLYRIEGDTVQVVGYVDKTKTEGNLNVLTVPHAVLRVLAGKAEWSYVDQVFSVNGPVAIKVQGTSRPGSKRKWNEQEVDTIQVHVDSHVGEGKGGYDVRQDMVYGKGIGLLETTEATKIQGKTVKKVLKLLKFEPPKG